MGKKHASFEDYCKARQNHLSMTPELRSLLDGVLLSDASISLGRSKKSASVTIWQHPSRLGWLEDLQVGLLQHGVVSKIDERIKKPKKLLEGRKLPGGPYKVLRTLSYVELVVEHQRWVPQGKKTVPKDLILNPVVVKHWFCGDGRGGDKKGTLGFSTDGFTETDVLWLVDQLRVRLGVNALRVFNHRGHPQILVSRKDEAVKLRCLMSPIPVCCEYKFEWVSAAAKTGKGRILGPELKLAVRDDKGNMSMHQAAMKHGVSVSKVWALWQE